MLMIDEILNSSHVAFGPFFPATFFQETYDYVSCPTLIGTKSGKSWDLQILKLFGLNEIIMVFQKRWIQWPFWDLTDVTVADKDTSSILTDTANRAIQGNVAM